MVNPQTIMMTHPNLLTSERSQALLADILPGLQRLDALLTEAADLAPQIYGPATAADRFRGLYVGQEETARLLHQQPGASRLFSNGHGTAVSFTTTSSRLGRLQKAYRLTPFDLDIILLALAPELDRRYERLYAYLQDHVGHRWPTVDLALHLLCADVADRLARRAHFNPDAPLMRHRIIHLAPESDSRPTSLLGRFLQLDEQITRFLLGQDGLDGRLTPFCHLHPPASAHPALNAASRQALTRLLDEAWNSGAVVRLYFHGPPTAGQRGAALAAAAFLECPLLNADLSRVPAPSITVDEALPLVLRYAWLYKAIPYFTGLETLSPDAWAALHDNVRAQRVGRVIILAGSQPWPGAADEPDDVLTVPFTMPGYEQRRACWQAHLAGRQRQLTDAELDTLAARFRLWPDQIAQTAVTVDAHLRWQIAAGHREPTATPTLADYFTAARAQSGHDLQSLAHKIEPLYTWDDIVLPPAARTQLHEICRQVIHRRQVLHQWGFGRRLSLGKGVNALFAGPSGTGKTMAADIIANELGLELYKIDLSGIVSKYIGETEKNLERIFRAAANANAILFFDEADALFGKRSEVRDSHDRYANIEISYLLQKIEAYDGLAILASNLRQNLDEAFIRRLAFTIHFPFPDEASRRQIWATIWPADAPLGDDVNLDALACQFKFSGGNIKNVALAAAYLAAAAAQPIGMGHLLQAVRREYQKMGKRISDDELSLVPRGGQHDPE